MDVRAYGWGGRLRVGRKIEGGEESVGVEEAQKGVEEEE